MNKIIGLFLTKYFTSVWITFILSHAICNIVTTKEQKILTIHEFYSIPREEIGSLFRFYKAEQNFFF